MGHPSPGGGGVIRTGIESHTMAYSDLKYCMLCVLYAQMEIRSITQKKNPKNQEGIFALFAMSAITVGYNLLSVDVIFHENSKSLWLVWPL